MATYKLILEYGGIELGITIFSPKGIAKTIIPIKSYLRTAEKIIDTNRNLDVGDLIYHNPRRSFKIKHIYRLYNIKADSIMICIDLEHVFIDEKELGNFTRELESNQWTIIHDFTPSQT